MIYQLTEKGKKMWPNYELNTNLMNLWHLALEDRRSNYRLVIAEYPSEIESLIRLGLIRDTTEILFCKAVEGCDNESYGSYCGMQMCPYHMKIQIEKPK